MGEEGRVVDFQGPNCNINQLYRAYKAQKASLSTMGGTHAQLFRQWLTWCSWSVAKLFFLSSGNQRLVLALERRHSLRAAYWMFARPLVYIVIQHQLFNNVWVWMKAASLPPRDHKKPSEGNRCAFIPRTEIALKWLRLNEGLPSKAKSLTSNSREERNQNVSPVGNLQADDYCLHFVYNHTIRRVDSSCLGRRGFKVKCRWRNKPFTSESCCE